MVKDMTLEDTWYVPCDVTIFEALELDRYLNKKRTDGDYVVSLYEGEFIFNDDKRLVRVIGRRVAKGKTAEERQFSKFQSDEDVVFILKCAKLLGYKIILDVKYSN